MRYRIIYAKNAQLRYTSVLDIQAIWEQSIRRAGISLEYSSGFHPQPKIQIALPLPLGYTSRHEIIDFWSINHTQTHKIFSLLKNSVPVGIEITSVEEIERNQKPVVNSIKTCEYILSLFPGIMEFSILGQRIVDLLNMKEIIRFKRNKEYDLRPLISDLNIVNQNPSRLFMRLTAQPGKTGRPDEVAFALGLGITDYLVERIAINKVAYA